MKTQELTDRLVQHLKSYHENRRAIIANVIPLRWYECDVLAFTKDGLFNEYEIKTSRSDFLKEFGIRSSKAEKHAKMAVGHPLGPSTYTIVVPTMDIVEPDLVPPYAEVYVLIDGIKWFVAKSGRWLHKEPMSVPRLANLTIKIWAKGDS